MSTEEEARAASEHVNQAVRLADLEQKYIDLEKDRNLWFDKAKAGDERLAKIETEKDSLQASLLNLRSDLSLTRTDLQEERDKAVAIIANSKAQQERASRVEAEADSLREEISRLTQTNKDVLNQVSEWETKSKLNDTSSIPLQYEVERVKKELDALSAHSRWLEEELALRSTELASTKSQHAETVMHLREEIDQIVVERDESLSEMNRLSSGKSGLERKVEKLAKDLRATQQDAATAQETSERELQAERKLVDLQQQRLDSVTSRQRRLETELEGLRDVANKTSTEQEDAVEGLRGEIQQEANKVLEDQEAAFKEELNELKKQLAEAKHGGPVGSPLKSRPILTAGGEPMGLTDVYVRLNQSEDDLLKERAASKRWKLALDKIHSDVAAKTPGLIRQKKEYEVAMERQEEMQERLSDSLNELKDMKEQMLEVNDEIDRLQRRNREYQEESKELANQVQALLVSKAGGVVPPGIPTSIQEIQKQNQQLLGEHRRLSNQVDKLQLKLRDDPKTARLRNAEQELEALREEQKLQEETVKSIVVQRDLYRNLVDSQSKTPSNISGTEMVVAQHSHAARASEERCKSLEQDLAKAQAEIIVTKGDKDAMLERVDRATIHTNELTVSIEKMQNELSSANAAVARCQADADYHRDKCARAEQSSESTSEELRRANESKKKFQGLNAQSHQQLATAKADLAKAENDLRQAEMRLRLAQTQAETSKSAESRLVGEVNQLRTELSRQGALLSSVQKIEATLTARNEEEKERLKEEVERLKGQRDQEVSKQGVDAENTSNRAKELEMELKEAERKKEQALKDSIAAKEEALAATTKRQELVAKVARLESELSSANKKLGQTSADPEEVALQTKIETLTQQLEESKTEVATLKERASNFQKVAKAGEQELSSLSKAGEDFKKGKAKEIEELLGRVESMKEERKKKDAIITELTKDLSAYRDEQKKSEDILKEQIAGMQGQVNSAKKDAEAAIARANGLQAEMQKYSTDASAAQSNYERELDLHASANQDLRAAREEIAGEQRLRTAAEEQLKNAKVEIAEKEKQLGEEKDKVANSLKEMEDSLKQTRSQNDLLLSQLSTLGDQVEKSQGERIEAASSDAPASEEVEGLRKSVSELREVVKFMRSEREMNQAQLDAAKRTAEREKASSNLTKRSLDEARAELKILQEEKSGDSSKSLSDLQEKLKQAEEQLTLLRESNKLLRDESTKVQESMDSTKSQLDKEKSSMAPLEKKQNELLLERAALVSEKESLNREVEAWKSRVQSLVSKFNQIDPVEHEKVIKEVGVLKKACDDLKTQKVAASKEATNAKALVSKLTKDLTQQKALVQKQSSLLKKLKVEKESATKTSSATAAVLTERDQLNEKVQKVQSDFASTKTELKGANDRIEMLKVRMRQFQKTIGDQRKKISDLETTVSAAATKGTDPKPPAPAPTTQAAKPADTGGPSGKKANETKDETKVQAVAIKQEQPTSSVKVPTKDVPKDTPKDVPKDAPKDTPKESAPSVPAGGFKFGPSSTQGTKTAAPTGSLGAPPAKKAKVVDKKEVQAKIEPTQPTKKTAPPPTVPPTKKAKVEDKKEDAPKTDSPDKAKAAEMLKEKLKQAMERKEKLKKRKMAVQSDQAQKRAATEAEQKQSGKEAEAKVEPAASSAKLSPKVSPKAPVPKSVSPVPKSFVSATKKAEAPAPAVVPVKEAPVVVPTAETKETPKETPAAPSKETAKDAPKDVSKAAPKEVPKAAPKETPKVGAFGSRTPFANSASFASAATAPQFGATSFGTPATSGGGFPFGPAKPGGGFDAAPAAGGLKKETSGSSTASSVFLDMKPPSSTAAPFSFGSSSIKLPTPTIAPPAGPSPFGAFTGVNPFAGPPATSAAKPLFGSSTSIKPADSEKDAKKGNEDQPKGDEA